MPCHVFAGMRLISSVDYFKSFKSPFSDNCECLITFLQVCGFEQIWLFTSVCSQTAPWRECFVTFWADMLLFTDLETFMCSQNAPLWECLVRIWAIMLLFTSVNYFLHLQSTFAWEYFVTFWVGMWLSFSVDQFMFFFSNSHFPQTLLVKKWPLACWFSWPTIITQNSLKAWEVSQLLVTPHYSLPLQLC